MPARQLGTELGAEDLVLVATGNLGWAYFELGDAQRALELFQDAESHAMRTGVIGSQITLLEDIGYVYQNEGEFASATQPYEKALDLSERFDRKTDIALCLEILGLAAIDVGNLDNAENDLNKAEPLEQANGTIKDGFLMLAKGKLAAARHNDEQAATILQSIESPSTIHTSVRLSAGLELAKLYERQGRSQDAESQYKASLATFETARATLKNEDSKLPFMANAMPLYDGYIHLLVQQGRVEDALEAADRSRARTLAQGLGLATARTALQPVVLHPAQIAQKTGATLLFYWLGEKQSYLWAITPQKTTLTLLPARAEITARVERYRKALLAMQNPLELDSREQSTQDGRALYDLLVAPAAHLLRRNAPVTILADGALSQLNFETLLAPGPGAGLEARSGNHYWIDDATLLSAPSLSMLSGAKPEGKSQGKMLLMGNAVSPNPDYPELAMAPMEMKLIQKHFFANGQTVFTGAGANPAAYLRSNPRQFSYIHFVTHGTASSTAPLDSAIILSRPSAADDGFKLYARDILQHPIDARLVTISACYGSGTRSYAGEGLVGLSWAFLRAGAHNVIGALWEVSDESTPRLMDSLYQGLEAGQTPSAALRRSKLTLLHSSGSYRAPFFWAPFQLYTGH